MVFVRPNPPGLPPLIKIMGILRHALTPEIGLRLTEIPDARDQNQESAGRAGFSGCREGRISSRLSERLLYRMG